MFYLLGFLRRTPLFGLIALPISIFLLDVNFTTIYQNAIEPISFAGYFSAFMLLSVLAYPIFVTIHLLMVKVRRKNRDLVEAYLSALGTDLIAPFRYISVFLAVILGKHRISDDSSFHNACDFAQVLFGFIWTIFMVVFFVIGFITVSNL